MSHEQTYTIFHEHQHLQTADLAQTLTHLKTQGSGEMLIFDDHKGKWTDFNLSGTLDEVLARELPKDPSQADLPATNPLKTGPGRPRLGVTAREVTLLPRHWEWLENQSGGASAALRRLVDEARRKYPEGERVRRAQAVADRFLGAFNLAGYEEATRALYNCDEATFMALSQPWPEAIRAHALHLAAPAFAGAEAGEVK